MSEKLIRFFNKQPRLGVLSTSNKEGKVNIAYFGSPYMVDDSTIIMGMAKNRSLSYLKENPFAAYIIMEPGNSMPEWKGLRLYLKMSDCQTEGVKLDEIRAKISRSAGENVGNMIHAAITFNILEVRPLIAFGQSWEQSI